MPVIVFSVESIISLFNEKNDYLLRPTPILWSQPRLTEPLILADMGFKQRWHLQIITSNSSVRFIGFLGFFSCDLKIEYIWNWPIDHSEWMKFEGLQVLFKLIVRWEMYETCFYTLLTFETGPSIRRKKNKTKSLGSFYDDPLKLNIIHFTNDCGYWLCQNMISKGIQFNSILFRAADLNLLTNISIFLRL